MSIFKELTAEEKIVADYRRQMSEALSVMARLTEEQRYAVNLALKSNSHCGHTLEIATRKFEAAQALGK